MKLIFSTLCVIALATLAHSSTSLWGTHNSSSILLSREYVVRTPLYNSYWDVNVNFPRSGQTNNRIITAVYAYDNFRNTSGAYPTLRSGGPNYRFATVNLRGQVNRGMDTTVEIWGRR